jgi:hypothetical protein
LKGAKAGGEIRSFVSFDTKIFADEYFANPKIQESEDIRYFVLGVEENGVRFFGLLLWRWNETQYFIRLGVFKRQNYHKFDFKTTLSRDFFFFFFFLKRS